MTTEKTTDPQNVMQVFGGPHRDLEPVEIYLNDEGNARLFAKRFQNDLRYNPELGWLHWTGNRWRADKAEVYVIRCARKLPGLIAMLAQYEPDEKFAKKIRAWANKSASRQSLESCVKLARSSPTFLVELNPHDQYENLLVVKNGVIDLSTGQLEEANRNRLILRQAPIVYDPTARCPLWVKTLHEIFSNEGSVVRYFQRAVGYTLTGSTKERAMFFLHGATGSNGKTLMLEILRRIFGEYESSMDLKLLTSRGVDREPLHAIAEVHQVRFLRATELPEGSRLNVSIVKRLTGRDSLSGRFLYERQFTFSPTHKIWIGTNHLPTVTQDQAIWDRIHVIPCHRRFRDLAEDKDREASLVPELPGILTWAVQGCIAWRREGLHPPEKISRTTQEYRKEQDPVKRFIEDWCEVDPKFAEPSGHLWLGFNRWKEEAGEPGDPRTKDAFTRRLTALGYPAIKATGGVRLRQGLRVNPEIDLES